MTENQQPSFWKSFGPGVLFAGAAIGNSHLVQSTRAGAMFGLGLLGLIVFTNVLKYPAFRFGAHYAGATGRSLISGYRQLGRWVVAIFALSEMFVMAIVIAASALTTAAVGLAITGLDIDVRYLGVGITIFGSVILIIGGYSLLDRMSKVFVAVLTLATVFAAVLALPSIEWSVESLSMPPMDFKTFTFIIALMGFMPAALSLSVLQSLWIVAKAEEGKTAISYKQSILDFNIGFIGSTILAVCFLIMGAGVLHPEGIEPAKSGGAFAAQVITLYTTNLGEWTGVFVAMSAMMVMFTTLVAVLDGFPRTLTACFFAIKNEKNNTQIDGSSVMTITTWILAAGAITVLLFFMKNFRDFIDFVTIAAFVVAPITAILNHIVITRYEVPVDKRPGRFLRLWSLTGIVLLSALSAGYFWQVL